MAPFCQEKKICNKIINFNHCFHFFKILSTFFKKYNRVLKNDISYFRLFIIKAKT